MPFGGRNFKYLKFRGVLPQKVPKKGGGSAFSVQIKALNISMPFLHALTDYRQILQLCVESKCAYDGSVKNEHCENSR